jgi:hypothetical protein
VGVVKDDQMETVNDGGVLGWMDQESYRHRSDEVQNVHDQIAWVEAAHEWHYGAPEDQRAVLAQAVDPELFVRECTRSKHKA